MRTSLSKERILLPIDDSEPSRRAVDYVASVKPGAEVTLFHVGAIPPELIEHPGAEDPYQEQRLEREVAEQSREYDDALADRLDDELFAAPRARLERAGSTVHQKLITEPHPDPGRAIVAELTAGDYDRVVIGRHHGGLVRRWLRGDTARHVERRVVEERVTVVE